MDEKRKLTMGTLAKTELHAPNFLTQKRSILLFLATVSIFAFLFILIYYPLGRIRAEVSIVHWKLPLYTIIVVGAGFVTLIISRIILYHYQKKHAMRLLGYSIWLIAEVAFFTLSLTVLAYYLNIRTEVSFLRLMSRIFLDVIGILIVPYIIAILLYIINEKRQEIRALHAMISDKSSEEGLVSSDTINFYDRGGRLVFATKKSNVLYIEASDNYTNIHYINEGHEDCFILHNSMKNVEGAYAKMGMMRCHRGYLVNLENVKLIRKEKDGLVIELTQSSKTIPVSKSYADRVAHSFAGVTNP
ncbi:MAG: LytTR family transcriptional regulator DNA-binding domain-containing protein [Bacteroidales bacterium]|nr:LytTR family transcriptional regulator DNA-binding domain-containing protein [Bacteroidales bacterium]MBR3413099.1 LytTR family transcriptional regulator DNA-binding domain-containing protein [Bacteroidales bacterium]